MLNIIPFQESNNRFIFDSPYLNGYLFENVLNPSLYSLLKSHVDNIISSTTKVTFLTHGTILNHNDKQIKIKDNTVDREQNVIFDITFDINYYYQTKETIKQWSKSQINVLVSPIFQALFNKLENLPPIVNNKDDWILYRSHINYLATNRLLALHVDGNPTIVNTYSSGTARMISATFYLHDHVQDLGGEFWTVNGFVYKPKQNCALLLNNGNCVLHGVTENKNPNPRLAFTTRFLHKDDMFLPGHPDKCLYNVDGLKLDDN